MIHVLVFVIEWSLMDTQLAQLHDFSQQISEVAVVIIVRKSFVATGGGGGTGGIGRGPASVQLPSGWHS